MRVGQLKKILKQFDDEQEIKLYSSLENDFIDFEEDHIDVDLKDNILIGE